MIAKISSRIFNELMYLILTLLFLIGLASASEQKTEEEKNVLDKTHAIFKGNLDYLANKVDSFFATERADDEFGRSTLRIRSNYFIREQEKGDFKVSYRINFKIPHLERRIKESADRIFKHRKEDDESESTTNEETDTPPRTRKGWIFNADLGVNATIPPKAVIRGRVRRNFLFTNWSHRFSEEITYITEEDGLTELTSFDSDYPIKENLLFRFINIKTWSVLSKKFDTSHGPSLIHQLSEKDALNYSFIASTRINEGLWFLDNYRLSTRYRRDLYKKWLYFDLITGLDFPKKYSFRRNPFATFQLEILFGS